VAFLGSFRDRHGSEPRETRGTNVTGRLEGKVAVVTGAGSGIGRAIAADFHREGAMVVHGDASGEEHSVAKELGDRAIGVTADVRSADDMKSLTEAAVTAFGGLDVFVNCAGIPGAQAPTADYAEGDFDLVIGVNLKGVFLGMRAALPHLVAGGGGSIVNIASIAALVGFPNTPAYSAAKGGIVALTRCTALEYAAVGVRVNVICPGVIDTPMTETIGDIRGMVIAATPVGRIGAPYDIAAAATFLASDDAAFVTGTVVSIDGGYTAH
jgi:NAD(P)-dependent dehydrogenase (short-subunit alcohol dehydrogenase family)